MALPSGSHFNCVLIKLGLVLVIYCPLGLCETTYVFIAENGSTRLVDEKPKNIVAVDGLQVSFVET